MKKLLLSISALMLLFQPIIAQNNNAHVGHTWCKSYEHQEAYYNSLSENDKVAYEESRRQLAEFTQRYAQDNPAQAGQRGVISYTIPVVFHVLHYGGPENVSNSDIDAAIENMNLDFQAMNADINNVHADFQGMQADIEVQFVKATIAPNGQCFSGVTRTYNDITFDGSSGWQQLTAIQNGNDVYQGEWPGDEYLNIFVVADAGGAGGYTTTPSFNTGMSNGIWILYGYIGSMSALTHEVGHWLNLEHVWGPNNNPGNANSCSSDDGVTDTPNCIGVTSCNLNENTCGSRANVENYMDYSYCYKMFTPGQKTRMHAALNSGTGGRNNVWSASNLTAVGGVLSPPMCAADFEANTINTCVGEIISFTDLSYHNPDAWTWSISGTQGTDWDFNTGFTSTDQNVDVVFLNPGNYTVTLQAEQSGNAVTESKTNYITVLDAPGALSPFVEGFESMTTVTGSGDWFLDNPSGGAAWSITSNAAASGSKSIVLNNSSSNAGNVDAFYSNSYDLSGAPDILLTFKYAYAQRNSSNNDKLLIQASNTCGGTWSTRKSISGSVLAQNVSPTGGSFVPTANDWTEVVVTTISSSYLVDNFRFRFEFESDGGNNIYIDDINLYSPNGVIEANSFEGFNVYPNPADEKTTITFDLQQNEEVEIAVFDMIGKIVYQSGSSQYSAGNNRVEIDTQKLTDGVYFIQLKTGNETSTKKLIVQ